MEGEKGLKILSAFSDFRVVAFKGELIEILRELMKL